MDMNNPKQVASFRANLLASNILTDYQQLINESTRMVIYPDNFWKNVSPEVQEAFNGVTFSLKNLMDVSNNDCKSIQQ